MHVMLPVGGVSRSSLNRTRLDVVEHFKVFILRLCPSSFKYALVKLILVSALCQESLMAIA